MRLGREFVTSFNIYLAQKLPVYDKMAGTHRIWKHLLKIYFAAKWPNSIANLFYGQNGPFS